MIVGGVVIGWLSILLNLIVGIIRALVLSFYYATIQEVKREMLTTKTVKNFLFKTYKLNRIKDFIENSSGK